MMSVADLVANRTEEVFWDADSRYRLRKLRHIDSENKTSHKIRHRNKQRKYSERFADAKIRYRTPKPSVNLDFVLNKNQSVIFKEVNNTVNYFSEDIVKEKVDIHEHCYTTNEVLEIIAVTCLVNFIFWFLIISCVNFYTKKEKVKCPSWESLESVSDYELKPQQETGKRRSVSNGSDDFEDDLENNFLIPESSRENVSDSHGKWAVFNAEEIPLAPDQDSGKDQRICVFFIPFPEEYQVFHT
ncbi:UNVERIFIED_CONTAM: hypothetical protein PYX00_000171 [Menopon gallinae]|uniref:Uncharacterized protein n=1 Tax=Menopon gallinae TaxID=328185 RepID=A0AAW2IA57_9NEOP